MLRDISIFSSLRDRDLAREGLIIGEGRFLAERIAASCSLVAAAAVPKAREKMETIIRGQCPLYEVSQEELSGTAGYGFHRGMLLAARRPEIPSLEGLRVPREGRRIVVCAGIGDPVNLGTIMRSAAALGWEGVFMDRNCADPFSRRTLRCSMGAALSLELGYFEGPGDMAYLKNTGWVLAGAAIGGKALPPAALASAEKLAILFGSEGFGLPEQLRDECSMEVYIPQVRNTMVDSLNVAAAAAILLWEGRPEDTGRGFPADHGCGP
ncbi:TrmH family RNA methyltransferase [Breznakiella homolactica]|uniref:RNA methyltransferase n=1 Tax=Breznakiella homolactica TaxID=2798577 RepID=A0A7T8BA64_9SPIR|nr:RNA methyltransferase [Breznakiella homolactica]QQO07908.1 RNA methyltransferase [Breznakiella homolactica]